MQTTKSSLFSEYGAAPALARAANARVEFATSSSKNKSVVDRAAVATNISAMESFLLAWQEARSQSSPAPRKLVHTALEDETTLLQDKFEELYKGALQKVSDDATAAAAHAGDPKLNMSDLWIVDATTGLPKAANEKETILEVCNSPTAASLKELWGPLVNSRDVLEQVVDNLVAQGSDIDYSERHDKVNKELSFDSVEERFECARQSL